VGIVACGSVIIFLSLSLQVRNVKALYHNTGAITFVNEVRVPSIRSPQAIVAPWLLADAGTQGHRARVPGPMGHHVDHDAVRGFLLRPSSFINHMYIMADILWCLIMQP
jgi:hypothetical protein